MQKLPKSTQAVLDFWRWQATKYRVEKSREFWRIENFPHVNREFLWKRNDLLEGILDKDLRMKITGAILRSRIPVFHFDGLKEIDLMEKNVGKTEVRSTLFVE